MQNKQKNEVVMLSDGKASLGLDVFGALSLSCFFASLDSKQRCQVSSWVQAFKFEGRDHTRDMSLGVIKTEILAKGMGLAGRIQEADTNANTTQKKRPRIRPRDNPLVKDGRGRTRKKAERASREHGSLLEIFQVLVCREGLYKYQQLVM